MTEAGDYTRAIEDLDSALTALKPATASNPDRAKWYEQIEAFVHNGRALALAGLGDLGAAEEEFERSIRLSPGNAWVYHNRGKVYDRAGDVGRATVEYRMALTKKDPALSALRRKQAEERLSQWVAKG